MSIDNEKLLIICGPTGVGKTSLAVKLANKFGGEIVSADSRQVYRKLDVITAKDTDTGVQRKLPWKEEDVPYCWEIDGVPTYLLDVVDPDKEFSVAIYERLAQRAIEFITSRGKLPIIAGGTGLYIKAIVDGIETMRIPPNKELRSQYRFKTAEELFMILSRLDQDFAASLNRSEQKNKQRLIRKIEILQQGVNKKDQQDSNPYNTLFVGLTADKNVLHKRIEKRVKEWMIGGAENEARHLLLENTISTQAASAIVLPVWKEYFEGKTTKRDVKEYWINKDWQYAKRQLTWFKKDKRINWYDISAPGWLGKVEKQVQKWYH
ncbi:MAG: tRNA (adenosine(37)-N6)-dimethylallyltransferase MiaA [Candidatus Blackburnbacteria bacterium RIFCSPHIGHO2_01_FULL_43_15b]|uniref:tRNA dimethylallyltransferase n=1 Tax=Candidatus Blackburnbacteria bacterium RIFCSPHIGHO2_01_FULL_43_15b TaxID=1797513 RepID=A0A1G1V387_9BACT|nr:MAG: tRNA (adenosine(37)-N6)-dimethylallyltransferase MiaA [Candidatus Blackburnbacteria bacterium RIFCSPHIGHO2_01_FULL_43_15b]